MTADRGPSAGEIAVMLADDVEAVVGELNLDVRRRTPRTIFCMSPAGGTSAKLEVQLAPIRGKWNDWKAGRYGDALGLVAYALGFEDPKAKDGVRQAIAWAKRFYGLEDQAFDPAAWAERRAKAEARAKDAEAKHRRELTEKRRTAQGIWLHAAPLCAGDVGWAYLEARGIDLAQLARLPRAIRVSDRQEWRDDEGAVRHVGPAIMSAMTTHDGKFGSLHRIWIDPARPGEKADLSHVEGRAAPRKMWPASEGCAIRLWRGESGLSEGDAKKAGLIEDMVVCEGVEDGLSIALMTPHLRIAAVGSLGGLLSFVPPKHVRCVTVAADNDWDNPAAQATLSRALDRLATEFGKLVRVSRSPVGKDFNDLLRNPEG